MRKRFEDIIQQLQLGDKLLHIEPLHGGALHKIWRIDTEQGRFAIKEINSHISSRRAFSKHHEMTEEIANQFYQHGLPAICALKINNHYVNKILDKYYVVYPYIDGHCIEPEKLNSSQLIKIGHFFSQMHLLDLKIKNVEKPYYDIHDNDYWSNLLNDRKTSVLSPCLDKIIEWNSIYHDCIPDLNKNLCITHRDMHAKNVLWDKNLNPHIIDWEAAGLMNPNMEIIGYGFEWGGIISGTFIEDQTKRIFKAYKDQCQFKLSADEIKQGFYGWLGHCVMGWTEFNLRRMMGQTSSDPSEVKIGVHIINRMKTVIQYIGDHEDKLIEMACTMLI